MNTIYTNPTRERGFPQEHVDRQLKSFFELEMPNPWPDAPATAPALPLVAARPWYRRYGRVAAAASIVLMLLGYWFLAGLFPRGDSGSSIDPNGHIGSDPNRKNQRPLVFPAPGKSQPR
ncbi:MAG: hypothetical protein L0215_06960 [Gemmataceae bacterium]|nr:hypothetical protein [Gemmataceae bacterium]